MKLIVNDTAGNVLHKAENSMCYPDKRQTHLWLHDGAELRHLIQWVHNVTDNVMTITVGERDLREEAARRRAFDRLRELAAGVMASDAPRPFTGALNDVPATLTHDEGAYAQCGECGRYTLNPNALTDRPPPCDCGSKHGWSGSFKRPGPDAKWSGLIQPTASGVGVSPHETFCEKPPTT